MERVERVDLMPAESLAAPERLPNGYLRVDGKIARVGLQEYEDPDGTTHMELRLPEEVFKPESMASFQLVPVTNTHPPVMLDAENTGSFAKGYSGQDVRRADDWLVAPLMITDRMLIEAAEGGRNQLSNGYTCRLDPTQDEALIAQWGPHKYVQRDIVGNHIALVDDARAGPEARIRLDNASARVSRLAADSVRRTNDTQAPEPPMAHLVIGTLRIDTTDPNPGVIQQAIDQALAAVRDDAKREKTRADAAEQLAKILRANGSAAIARVNRIVRLIDAKKAMMTTCDECSGTGKVDDDANPGQQKTCDFCDGDGEYRMHTPVGGAAGESKDDDPIDGDPDGELEEESEEGEMDADELEVEQETENEAGAAKKDAARRARARKRRADAVEQQKQLAASRRRLIDRASRKRVALIDTARRFLDQDVDLSKMDERGIKVAVLSKLNPNVKLDGKTDGAIDERFEAAVEAHADATEQGNNGTGETGAQAGHIDARTREIVDAVRSGQRGQADRPLRGRAAFLKQRSDAAAVASGRKSIADYQSGK